MSTRSFDNLAAKIYAEYRAKGYSVTDSIRIADGTAGEIAHEKRGGRGRRYANRKRH